MTRSDIIFINSLTVKTIIGVWDWERQLPQNVVVDLQIEIDAAAAAASDDLADALDYKAVADAVRALLVDGQFKLVETAAERVAALILGDFGARGVKVTLSKPNAVRGSTAVGTTIERRRSA